MGVRANKKMAPSLDDEARLAIGDAVAKYERDLIAFAYRLLGDRADAEDALQEAFAQAIATALGGDLDAATARAWLYRVVYHRCCDRLRRRRRVRHDSLDAVDEIGVDGGHESVVAVSQALMSLDSLHRAAVILVDVHGLSYDEAAEVLAVPRGTVASRLNAARGNLRRELGVE
jgi:RNA polymerase sigma-70 factor, ECF subfamily